MKLSHLFGSFLVTALISATSLFAIKVDEITDVTPKVDVPPVVTRAKAPDYPAALRKNRVSGIVSVVAVIDETGVVLACEVVKSSDKGFDKAATDAVLQWRFSPAKVDGKNVKVKVTIPIRFSLEDE